MSFCNVTVIRSFESSWHSWIELCFDCSSTYHYKCNCTIFFLYQIIYSVSSHLLKLSERATLLLLTDGTKIIGSCKCLSLISHEWSPHFGGLKQRQTESVRWVKREGWEGEEKQSAARRLAGEKWSSPIADGYKTSWVVTLSASAFQTRKHLFTQVCFTVGFYHSSSQL